MKDTGIPATAAPATPVATDESEVASLRKLLLGSLPEHYERQIERLEAKIAEGASELHAALSALEQRLEKRIVGADADSRTSTGELRQLLLDEMRGANEAIRNYHADAMRRLEHGLQDVQDAKLDQATFSTFLESLARYLSHEDAVPTNAQEIAMTKIYDALKLAETDRSSGKFAEPRAITGLAVKTPGAGELDQIRAILIGDLPELLEEASIASARRSTSIPRRCAPISSSSRRSSTSTSPRSRRVRSTATTSCATRSCRNRSC